MAKNRIVLDIEMIGLQLEHCTESSVVYRTEDYFLCPLGSL